MKKVALLTLFLLLVGCDSLEKSNSLKEVWRSSGERLSVPESVIYDSKENTIFVSNVNSLKNPWSNNGGFISKLDTNGKVIKLKWAIGLKAPKGLVSAKGHIYASDLDEIKDINSSTGEIINIFKAPKGIDRLNDIAYDNKRDMLFVSDSRTKKIFQVSMNGKFTLLYDRENSKDAEQNGLFVDGNNLIMQGRVGSLKSLNLNSKIVKVITNKLDIAIDGITKYRDRGFIVSTWSGGVYFIDKNSSKNIEQILGNSFNTADIFYSKDLNLLLIPDFADKILAYRVNQN